MLQESPEALLRLHVGRAELQAGHCILQVTAKHEDAESHTTTDECSKWELFGAREGRSWWEARKNFPCFLLRAQHEEERMWPRWLSVCRTPAWAAQGWLLLTLPFLQVTHMCWVPGEPYVIQTSEDKTVR